MTRASGVRDHDSSALARFDLFLLAAVATVLVVRAFLAATGYPQIGGGALHIAHVLWGGLLMGTALVSVEIAEGSRVRVFAALVGGIGFGLFIDEIGKFVTADVNYFFQPAIALIYVVFVLFYLIAREAITRMGLPDQRRVAIASAAVTDLALGHLDEIRRHAALDALDGIRDPRFAEIASSLRSALIGQDVPASTFGSRMVQARNTFTRRCETLLGHRIVQRIVLALFVIQAVLAIGSVAAALLSDNERDIDDLSDTLVQLSSTLSGLLTLAGVWFLVRGPYLRALRLLRAAVIVNLLLTQVFLFAQEQFGALSGFAISLLMLACLQIAIRIAEDVTSATVPSNA